jgi:hypothetical protein
MEQHLPKQIGDYRFVTGNAGPEQTYKMEPSTYDALRPFGIVCRKFSNGDKTFDVVVIASSSRASFHDPRLCFSAQGWNITKESQYTFQDNGENVPCTVVDMESPAGKSIAIFFYKGPDGYYGSTTKLKIGMFMNDLKGKLKGDGVFYRIIPEFPGATIDQVAEFAKLVKREVAKSSDGYF